VVICIIVNFDVVICRIVNFDVVICRADKFDVVVCHRKCICSLTYRITFETIVRMETRITVVAVMLLSL